MRISSLIISQIKHAALDLLMLCAIGCLLNVNLPKAGMENVSPRWLASTSVEQLIMDCQCQA